MKKTNFGIAFAFTCLIAAINVGPSYAKNLDNDMPAAPDNTGINKRDRTGDEVTADQASQKKNDVEIMQSIRKAIMADDTLSMTAQNIKVISIDGRVTLKGPVKSNEERQNIHAKAADVAGADNVINKLSIKGENTSDKTRQDDKSTQ